MNLILRPFVMVFACLLVVGCPITGHAAESVREAALKFAVGWDNWRTVLGFSGLSDPRTFNEYKDTLDPHREVLRQGGGKELREAGERLDHLARSYAEATDLGLDSSKWRDRDGKATPYPPLAFRRPELNALLGIDAGEQDNQKILDALRRATLQFAKVAGIHDELLAHRKKGPVKPAF